MKHSPLLPLMFLFALLSGCAPAVLITSASVATRTATDPRSIRARLLLSPGTRLADVKVVTENNEVFLMGLVTQEEGQRVTDLVSRISGVTHVTTAWTFTQIPAQTPPAG